MSTTSTSESSESVSVLTTVTNSSSVHAQETNSAAITIEEGSDGGEDGDGSGEQKTTATPGVNQWGALCGLPPPQFLRLDGSIGLTTPLLPSPMNLGYQKPCLVLDLDETLAHCELQPLEFGNVEFKVRDFTVHGAIRPGAREFLKRVSEHYEVVIFTASMRDYADQLIDILDPEGLYVSHRLFRTACLQVAPYQIFLKDLAALGRDLSRCVLVDNSPIAAALQLSNLLPVPDWLNDPHDRHLEEVYATLMELLESEADFREVLSRKFGCMANVAAAVPVSIMNASSPEFKSAHVQFANAAWHFQRQTCTTATGEPMPPNRRIRKEISDAIQFLNQGRWYAAGRGGSTDSWCDWEDIRTAYKNNSVQSLPRIYGQNTQHGIPGSPTLVEPPSPFQALASTKILVADAKARSPQMVPQNAPASMISSVGSVTPSVAATNAGTFALPPPHSPTTTSESIHQNINCDTLAPNPPKSVVGSGGEMGVGRSVERVGFHDLSVYVSDDDDDGEILSPSTSTSSAQGSFLVSGEPGGHLIGPLSSSPPPSGSELGFTPIPFGSTSGGATSGAFCDFLSSSHLVTAGTIPTVKLYSGGLRTPVAAPLSAPPPRAHTTPLRVKRDFGILHHHHAAAVMGLGEGNGGQESQLPPTYPTSISDSKSPRRRSFSPPPSSSLLSTPTPTNMSDNNGSPGSAKRTTM